MSIFRRCAGALVVVLSLAAPASALDIQSTKVPGRTVPALTNGEIAVNRADKRLIFQNVDGSLGYGSLLNALASGRKAVEQGDASDLTVSAGTPISLAQSAILTLQGINALLYVPLTALLAGSDVSNAFRQAVAAARAAQRPLLVPGLPGGACFVLNKSIDVNAVEIAGTGGCVSTAAAIDLFTTSSVLAKIHDLSIQHTGSAGRVFNLLNDAHEIYRNRITATHVTNPDPIIQFNASNVHIHDNNITNLRPKALTWRQVRNDAARISINNQITRNYMGGTGKGGWVGDDGTNPRPEGTLVAFNESVLTGGPFLTLSSVLSARVFGNMMDQGPTTGALRFEPGGYGGYGIDGVLVSGNYISSTFGGAAIQNQAGVNGAVASGVRFIGNDIAFGTLAASFVRGITATFSGNFMHGMSAGNCITVSDATTLAALELGAVSQCPGKSLVLVTGASQAGAQRSTVIGAYSTANGGGYLNVVHGLAGKPTKFRVGISTVGKGGASLASVSAFVVAVDTVNVTLSITATGINANGTIWITLDSDI